MATATHIKNEAAAIKSRHGALSTGDNLSFSLREQLETLAQLCGMETRQSTKATDNDLISVYLVALKDGTAAQRVALRVQMRLDPSNVPDPAPRMPPIPEPDEPPATMLEPVRPPPSTPQAPTAAPSASLDAIRDLIKQEVREGALEPLQATLEAELARVPLSAAEAALAAVRAELRTEAHAAALEALKSLTPTRLEIVPPNAAPVINLGIVHRLTPKIIAMLSAGVNVYLFGPAGSGKTTVARKCAEAFGVEFRFAAKVESEYQLIGFKDAKGDTIRTQFREAYEHGGVFLFDEMDASSPSAVVALNAALANGICPFPDAIIPRHENFLCIGAGNTKLTGANRQYAGRNQLDAASIDRFAFLEFGYDDDLENALAADITWARYVQRVRHVIAERGLNHLVTPRATYDGCKLLAQGFDRDEVASMVVYKGLDADTRRQIENAL